MDDYHYTDDLEPTSLCPGCGEPMETDTDGDGVMTMSYEFCEDCGAKDYGEPVRLTEQIIAKMREEEATGGATGPEPAAQPVDVPAG